MKNVVFYGNMPQKIRMVIILFAVLVASSMITTAKAQLATNILPKERAQLLIAKLVPPMTEETKKLFWDDGKKTMETYFAELREASGGRNEDVVLQLMYFSQLSTNMMQGMAAGYIIKQMKISQSEIATALLPFLETQDKKLRGKISNWVGGILEAYVRLKPEALEVSPGILTAFVRLSEGYPATNIVFAICDGAQPERMMPNEDGAEMVIKFRRQDIEKALAQTGERIDTNFVVRGVWKDTTQIRLFEGTGSIKKIVDGKSK